MINQTGLTYYIKRDDESFNELYKDMYSYFYNCIRKWGMSHDDITLCRDLTIQKIWEDIDKYDTNYPFTSFVYFMIKNTVNRFLFMNKRYQDRIYNYDVWKKKYDEIDLETIIDKDKLFFELLKDIKEPHKTMMNRRYDKVPIKDIAIEFGKSYVNTQQFIRTTTNKMKNVYQNKL